MTEAPKSSLDDEDAWDFWNEEEPPQEMVNRALIQGCGSPPRENNDIPAVTASEFIENMQEIAMVTFNHY